MELRDIQASPEAAKLVDAPSDLADPYVKIWAREEKGSDVNLAVHMLHDAWKDIYDCAIVLSNDSDLAEALRLVRSMGKVMGVLCPTTSGPARELHAQADFVRPIRPAHLAKSQLLDPLFLDDGSKLFCPPRWLARH